MERLSRFQFVCWLRTGRVPLDPEQATEVKFNPNHDPKNGQFTFAGQGEQSGGNSDHPATNALRQPRRNRSPNMRRRTANLNDVKRDLADPKVQALVDLIGNRETGGHFNVIVGGTKFSDFSRHPNVLVNKYNSTAAGAYQFNAGTWKDVSSALGLTDFTPQSQRYGAVYLLRRLGAIQKLQNGDVEGAILAAGKRWDSLPKDVNGKSLSGAKHPLKPIVDAYRTSLSHHLAHSTDRNEGVKGSRECLAQSHSG
jgi:muramidase (phage lysozyme)